VSGAAQPVRGPVWPFPPAPADYAAAPPPEPEHVPTPPWRPTGDEPAAPF
jgi:hypothetical protein